MGSGSLAACKTASIALESNLTNVSGFTRPYFLVLRERNPTILGPESALDHEIVFAADRHVGNDEPALVDRGDLSQPQAIPWRGSDQLIV